MLAVQRPPEIEERLAARSRRTGRGRNEHIREAILEHPEERENAALAEQRLDALARGGGTVPLAALMARCGVGD